MIWLTLTPAQIEWADRRGQLYFDRARAWNLQHRNNLERNNTRDFKRSKEAMRAELAAFLGLKGKRFHALEPWSPLIHKPDFDDFVDAKERKEDHHHLIVQRDAPAHWAYVSVYSEMCPEFCIDFWAWGSEIKAEENWKSLSEGRPAYCIDQWAEIAKPVEQLMEIMMERQNANNSISR